MCFEGTFSTEHFATDTAFMRSFTGVCECVCFESTLRTETLVTDIASMRSFPGVFESVRCKVNLFSEPPATVTALKGFFNRMCGCVC